MKKFRVLFFILFCLFYLSGCGGGKDKNSSGTVTNTPQTQDAGKRTILQGAAIKGPVRFGRVELFTIDENGSGILLDSITTDSVAGTYSFEDIAAAGPLKIIVKEGNYKDETTGKNVILQDGDMMAAVVSSLPEGATTIVNITPLTTMAASMAENLNGGLTPANIDSANKLVGRFFTVSNILSVTPIDTLKEGGSLGRSSQEVDYGLILAGISMTAHELDLKNPFALVAVLADDASDGIFNGKMGSILLKVEGRSLPVAAGYVGLANAAETFANDLVKNLSGGMISSTLKDTLGSSGGIISGISPPKIFSIQPSSAPLTGGVSIIVRGRPILDDATVEIGGINAPVLSMVHGTEKDTITVTLPSSTAAGRVDVVVKNPDGQIGKLLSGFSYVSPPEITQISLVSGRETGGTRLVITGNGFIRGASVTVGGKNALAVTVQSSTKISLKTPPGSGTADIIVTNPDDQSATFSGFTYLSLQDAPLPVSITAIIPASGSSAGGTPVTISGRGFDSGTRVTIGGVPVVNLSVDSEHIITAETAAGSYTPIPANVVVSDGKGETRSLKSAFRYVEAGTPPLFELSGYTIPADSDDSRAIKFVDIDNDLDYDIVVANIGQNRLYLNDGKGNFTDATADYLVLVNDATRDVGAADINGDGYMDIFFANTGTDILLINNGGTGFTDETAGRMPQESAAYLQSDEHGVIFEDINNDGAPDLLLLYDGLSPRLYINNGGSFLDNTPSAFPNARSRSAVVADFTGNGEPDIVVANNGSQAYFLKDDLLTLTYPFFLSMNATSIASGDIDRDGKNDIVFGTADGARLYIGDGNGGFTEAGDQLPDIFDFVNDVRFIDMDGADGPDLFVTNNGQNRVYINNGAGYFSDETDKYLPAFNVTGFSMDYLPGTSGLIVTANSGSQQNRIYRRGTTAPVFSDITGTFPSDSVITRDVAVGDMNNDGYLDLFLANDNSTMSRLMINNGTGGFTDETIQRFGSSIPTGSAEEVVLEDLNGDDYPDILIINDDFKQDRLYINDKTGNFSDQTSLRLPQDSENGEGAVIGDIDGDGLPDIVTAEFGSERILINDGTGNFIDETIGRFPFSEENSNDTSAELLLLDIEQDGDLDIFVVNNDEVGKNPTNRQNRLYKNNGTGFFTETTLSSLPFENDHSRDGDTGDIDGDTDLDIVIANDIYPNETPENRIYRNDGTGNFLWSGSQLDVNTGDGSEDARLADFDGDGDLDIFISNDTGTQNRLYLNDSTGSFSELPSSLPQVFDETNDAAIGDFDGDGDIDLVIGNKGQTRLLINRSR